MKRKPKIIVFFSLFFVLLVILISKMFLANEKILENDNKDITLSVCVEEDREIMIENLLKYYNNRYKENIQIEFTIIPSEPMARKIGRAHV